MTGTDPVAWLALVASMFAAFFTWQTANQARRQADAVLGDLPPTISIYQPSNTGSRVYAIVELEIVNHNRLPIYIDRWQFDFPEGMRIFRDHDDSRASIGAIMDSVLYKKTDFVHDLSMRMPGNAPHDPAPVERAMFHVTTSESKMPTEPFDVGVTVWYRVDGEDQAHEIKRSVTWRPIVKDR